MDIAPYFHKTAAFKFSGADLRLDLSHALFSSFDVDRGTKLLLKAVARDPVLARARRVLDEGCGVGVIGLAIAKAFPGAEVSLRDRDSLAVAFAERNRLSNKLRGIPAYSDPATGTERLAVAAPGASWGLIGSYGRSDSFDFVLSNLPAKAGGPVLASFFGSLTGKGGGVPLLAPGGRAAIVIVEPLAAQAESWIAEAGLAIAARSRGADHRVYLLDAAEGAAAESAGPAAARAAPARAADARAETADSTSETPAEAPDSPLSGLDLRAYNRTEGRFRMADLSYRAKGFWGLPEFDTPGFGSSAAAELASRVLPESRMGDILVIDPGVGHFALWASRALRPGRLAAASRDLLALAATGANIAALPRSSRPEYAAIDELKLDSLAESSFDLIADFSEGVPEMDGAGPAWERASRLVRPGGVFLASRGLGEMARLERRKPVGQAAGAPEEAPRPLWTALGRRRKKGAVAAAWRKG